MPRAEIENLEESDQSGTDYAAVGAWIGVICCLVVLVWIVVYVKKKIVE